MSFFATLNQSILALSFWLAREERDCRWAIRGQGRDGDDDWGFHDPNVLFDG